MSLRGWYPSAAILAFGALCWAVATGARGADDAAFRAPQESNDYALAMKRIAAKFRGKPGIYLHLGDSLTYANPNTAWAREGRGHTPEEEAFLKWSHGGEKSDADGWHLASVDVLVGDAPAGRSRTAASGVRADEYLRGGKNGLPPLSEIIKTYNPQLALYLLGSNDLIADRAVAQYIRDVEEAIDLLLANGTVPILSTLPPCRGKAERVEEYNAALRGLAKEKQLPLIDLHAEMKARAGEETETLYLGEDGVHLTYQPPDGPASAENLRRCGYLLRCYLAVHKGMEVKAKVFDATEPLPSPLEGRVIRDSTVAQLLRAAESVAPPLFTDMGHYD